MTDTCTTREVAQLLGMAVRSVQMMVDRGELEAWKTPGGHRRISRQSVDRWMAGRGRELSAPATTSTATSTRSAHRWRRTATVRFCLRIWLEETLWQGRESLN